MQIIRDIPYISTGIQSVQRLDMYLPDVTAQPIPVILSVHGGGWRNGDRSYCPVTWLADEGFAVLSIDYRLSGEAIFPAQLEDCRTAVRWVRAHAKEYGFASQRIGVEGDSAGGHLAALLGVTGSAPTVPDDEYTDYSGDVQAVCDFFGPVDFLSYYDFAVETNSTSICSSLAALFGGLPAERTALVQSASPLTYITPRCPPFFIVHGTQDQCVPYDQSVRLHAALEAAGVDSTLLLIDGVGHSCEASVDRATLRSFFARNLAI